MNFQVAFNLLDSPQVKLNCNGLVFVLEQFLEVVAVDLFLVGPSRCQQRQLLVDQPLQSVHSVKFAEDLTVLAINFLVADEEHEALAQRRVGLILLVYL